MTNHDDAEGHSSTRRSVLLGLGAGAAGAVVGGTGVAAAQDDGNGGNGEDGATTYVRGAHMVRGVPPVAGYVDGEVVEAFQTVEYLDVTEYAPLSPGVHEFRAVVPSMDDRTIYNAQAALGPGAYTAVALGDLQNGERPAPMLLQDGLNVGTGLPEQAQGRGRARGLNGDSAYLRVVHAVPGAPPVTLRAGGGRTLVENVQYAETTTYMEVPAGSRTVVIRSAEDDSELGRFDATLEAGVVYTAFAAPGGDGAIEPVLASDAVESDE